MKLSGTSFKTLVITISLSAIATITSAASSSGTDSINQTLAAAVTVNEESSTKDKVLNDESAEERGELRFAQNCVYCHGDKGSGGKAKPLQGREFTDDYLFKVITQGKRRGSLVMPPWGKSMSEEFRWELVSYIQSLSK